MTSFLITFLAIADRKQFAKLENNLIIAMFTAMFDYELTDKSGKPVQETPEVDFNGTSAMKPHVRPFVKYTTRS